MGHGTKSQEEKCGLMKHSLGPKEQLHDLGCRLKYFKGIIKRSKGVNMEIQLPHRQHLLFTPLQLFNSYTYFGN